MSIPPRRPLRLRGRAPGASPWSMRSVSRRSFLAGAAAATGALALPTFAFADPSGAIPRIPLVFSVVVEDGRPLRDSAWLDEQVAEMESISGRSVFTRTGSASRPLAAQYAAIETLDDRDALGAFVQPHVVNVFIIRTLRDLAESPAYRHGATWRSRTNRGARYAILTADAVRAGLAHEMGHYFGAVHVTTVDNVMSDQRTGARLFLDDVQARTIQGAARRAFQSGKLIEVPRT